MGTSTNVVGSAWFDQTAPYVHGDPGNNRPYESYFCPDGAVPTRFRQALVDVLGGGMEYVVYAGMPSPVGGAAPRMPLNYDDTIDQFYRRKVLVADVCRWDIVPTNSNNGSPIHTTHENTGKAHYRFPSGSIPGLTYEVGTPRGMNVAYSDGSVRWNLWERMDFTKFIFTGSGRYTLLWDQDY
jgi:hypothetical protein